MLDYWKAKFSDTIETITKFSEHLKSTRRAQSDGKFQMKIVEIFSAASLGDLHLIRCRGNTSNEQFMIVKGDWYELGTRSFTDLSKLRYYQ